MLLLLPFPVVAFAARACLPKIGDGIARTLSGVAILVPDGPHEGSRGGAHGHAGESPGGAAPAPHAAGGGSAAKGDDPPRVANANGGRPGRGGARRDGGAPRSIRVRAREVERAMAGGLDGVRGRTARDESGRPIGVRLHAVTALGVGLADGDVVTSIDGTPTPDDDTATVVALGAIGRGARSIRATLLRNGEPIDVMLDLPDVDAGTVR